MCTDMHRSTQWRNERTAVPSRRIKHGYLEVVLVQGVGGEEGSEDEGDDGHELHQNVEGRSGSILERITNGITDNGGLVGVGALAAVEALFDVLLGVIPGTTGVGGGDSHLDTGDEATGEHTGEGVDAEEVAGDDGGEDDEAAGRNHLLEGGVGGDGDALLVVGLLGTVHDAGLLSELSSDLLDHGLGGLTDGLHGHGGEPVGKHGANQETSEGDGLEDIDASDVAAGDEGAEQGEGDEGGGANSEALADGGGGVTGGVEGIGLSADGGGETGHFGDTSGVIGDRTVAIDGEGAGEGGEHAEGGEGDAVHIGEPEGEEDGDGEGDDGDDVGEVAEGEAEDDVGGGTGLAGGGDLLDGAVGVGGHVVGDEADEEAGPETAEQADVGVEGSGGLAAEGAVGLDGVVDDDAELLGEGVEAEGGEDAGGEDGGEDELDLEVTLDVVLVLDVEAGDGGGEEGGHEAAEDAAGGDEQREEEGGVGGVELGGHGGDQEGGAGGLGEGTEKIGAHTGDITDVVTDVIGNDGGVTGVILGNTGLDLADEIGTDIGSLGVDTATDSSEEGDGGTTETVTGDGFEETLSGVRISLDVEGEVEAEELDDDVDDEQTDGGEGETHDGAGAEGDVEALGPADLAHGGGSGVGVDGDDHADVAGEQGGETTDHEGDSGETTVGPAGLSAAVPLAA